ncbi:MAG: hypothetical protein AB1756_04560 [Acidobacteriota bacterium]
MSQLTRMRIEQSIVSTMLKGRWSKADLFLIELGGRKIVLKDFAGKVFFIRMIGRLQIGREEKAYRAVQGVDGIPRFYGRPDRWSLAIEYVDGVRLSEYKGPVRIVDLLAELRTVIDGIHRAGVVHNDIRGRENIIVTQDGNRLKLLDLAGAIIFKHGTLSSKLLFPLFKKVDDAAYLKWKNELAPEEMSDQEKKFLRRFNLLRKFWIFNIKGK